jgi:hypothetical protein
MCFLLGTDGNFVYCLEENSLSWVKVGCLEYEAEFVR